jgi:beta-fructofuranosidase
MAASAFAAGAMPLLPVANAAEKSTGPGQIPEKSEATREFFYRPADAWTMDPIPYFHDGRFHLFSLLDWRDGAAHEGGLPWFQVSTTDFMHFVEHGEMLPRGTKDEQDLNMCTGSAIQGEGKYHIWYAGDNPDWAAKGKPKEAAMHAVSDDLFHWTKIPEDSFASAPALYDRDDWRDQFVFWNEEAGEYWMLVAARTKTGPSRRRGCTALCVSKDLKKWDVREPLYAPGLYQIHECPDMFKMGDWWYLVFSEYTDLIRTRYRMSRSSKGPWITPDDDCFDGRALYAAKTATDGQHRYLFGWNPTRTNKKDYSTWDWGGNLVVHELKQEPDGTLTAAVPATIDAAFAKPLVAPFPPALAQCPSIAQRSATLHRMEMRRVQLPPFLA